MKKTFQKTLIAVATGAALMSTVGTASANSLLFPFYQVGAGVQSVISLSNTSTVTEDIHYAYSYGSTCAHYDTWGKLTANDIISHSVAAPAAGGIGIVPSNDGSTAGYLPLTAATGFAIVSNVTSANTTALRGSLAVIEAATTGVFMSYAGIPNDVSTISALPGKYILAGDGNVNEGNFNLATLNAAGFGPALAQLNFPLTWLPTATVTTSWWSLAIGDMNAFARGASQTWTGTYGITNATSNNVFDNDENFRSGTTPVAAACQGSFAATALLTEGQKQAFVTDPVMNKGGGSGLYKGNGTVNAVADNVILMKLQRVTSGSSSYDRGTLVHRENGRTAVY